MRRKSAVSEILLTRILPELKNKTPYFSMKAVKHALTEANLTLTNETLREYMSEAMATGIVQDAGRGWYSRHEKTVSLDPKPLAKIIRTMAKAFPLLDFYCWSTVQFNLFAQHLIAQPTFLLYAESDALESVAERLREAGWNAWANPNQKEAEKLVRPGEKSVVLRPAISKQPEGTNHVASIEKALVDLIVEAPRLQLMDPAEAQRILDTCLQSGLLQLPVLMTYSKRRAHQVNSSQITN